MDFFTTPLVAGPVRIVAWEVLYVIVLVQVLAMVLDRHLFRPITRVLDERKRRVEVANTVREEALTALEEKTRQHAERIADARRQAVAALETARGEAEAVRREQVHDAMATAEGRVTIAKEAVAKATKKAEHELKLGAIQHGRQIASTLLGREVA